LYFMSILTPEQIRDLSDKWLKGTLTGKELELFEQWYNQQLPESVLWEKDAGESALKERLFAGISGRREENLPGAGERKENGDSRLIIFTWRRMAVASVVLLLGAGVVVWSRYSARRTIAGSDRPAVAFQKDFAPGGSKARLTLDDGSTIALDSSTTRGRLAQQGKTSIMNMSDGSLVYRIDGDAGDGKTGTAGAGAVSYNTVSTARGGQYRLQLPDGTAVWLNAASSLRFPTGFIGKERVVELKGEAYFEVAANVSMPFHVKLRTASGEGDVEVLGTSFDINAYEDEQIVRTSLVEGAVRVRAGSAAALLRPGQQAQLVGVGPVRVKDNVNMDEVVAWRNNRFYFKSADIRTIMRQISRWYDVEVEYTAAAPSGDSGKKVSPRFNTEISRNTNASDILTALELTGKVKFRIENKKIIVDMTN
jgi:ferric-dicitrate binding protein FerR (iron transport regulator)